MVVTGRVWCRGRVSVSAAASQSCDYKAAFMEASLQAAHRSKCSTLRWYRPFRSQCVY